MQQPTRATAPLLTHGGYFGLRNAGQFLWRRCREPIHTDHGHVGCRASRIRRGIDHRVGPCKQLDPCVVLRPPSLLSASSRISTIWGAAYDGFQYSIQGSNDGTTWTPLFDALTVFGAGEPFTFGTFSGTAPTTVNNVLTPGAGPNGTVGYIADFNFNDAFQIYAFGASQVAFNQFNADQELSAVAAAPVPGRPFWLVAVPPSRKLPELTRRGYR